MTQGPRAPQEKPDRPKSKRGGSKKGERRGGRKKGTKNKATVERELLAQREAEANSKASQFTEAQGSRRKLGKEILADFANVFAGMAAYYQPSPPHARIQNEHEDEKRFITYSKMAMDAARDVAGYQSPKLSAVVVGQATVTKIKVEGGMPEDFKPPAPDRVEFVPGTIITAEDETPDSKIINLPTIGEKK